MQTFKNFLATLITILIFSLWFVPLSMYCRDGKPEWNFLYIPVVGLFFAWGDVLNKHYFKNKN